MTGWCQTNDICGTQLEQVKYDYIAPTDCEYDCEFMELSLPFTTASFVSPEGGGYFPQTIDEELFRPEPEPVLKRPHGNNPYGSRGCASCVACRRRKGKV